MGGKRRSGGGSATGGGVNFQARVTALAYTHLLDGSSMGWLDGINKDVPIEVSAETEGPGDDIRFLYANNSTSEIQVKKGLTRGNNLWDALIKLAHGINESAIGYGVLAVCPESSVSIRKDLAKDISRVGEGRYDGLKDISKEFLQKLNENKLPAQKVCSKLRVVVVNALLSDLDSISLAKTKLLALCSGDTNASLAWNVLSIDAARLIEFRGKRNVQTLANLLKNSEVGISSKNEYLKPLILFDRLQEWSESAHEYYSIFGVDQPISLDRSWIPTKAVVKTSRDVEVEEVSEALKKYHAWRDKAGSRDETEIDPRTIGLYFKHCVVVAGPGMGKTTLLKKLFRFYNQMGKPAIFVKLPSLAVRMEKHGDSFQEAVFNLGLDSSGINSNEVINSSFRNWVFLFDGLDECGASQKIICEAIINHQAHFPQTRIVLTTRPIGYTTPLLSGWRHYELLPLEKDNARSSIEMILSNISNIDTEHATNILQFVDDELEGKKFSDVLLRSPLLLGLSASLAIRAIGFGNTKAELYEKLFNLIEDDTGSRNAESQVDKVRLTYFLSCLGWALSCYPTKNKEYIHDIVAGWFSDKFGINKLRAKSTLEHCLCYWEEKGVVETIRHSQGKYLTFIHKTFGEYWAGKYLTSLSSDELGSLLKSIDMSRSYEEELIFAASLGKSEDIAKYFLARWEVNKDHRLVSYLLDIVGVSESPPEKEVRGHIFELAVKELLSYDKNHVFQFAAKLVICCQLFPKEVARYSNKYVRHENFSTQVSCVALSLISEDYVLTIQEHEDLFLKFFAHRYNRDYLFSSGGLFGGSAWFDLKKEFVLKSVELFLDQINEDEQERIFSGTIYANGRMSVYLISALENLFKRRGSEAHAGKLFKVGAKVAKGFLAQFNSKAYKEKEFNSVTALCSLLVKKGDDAENIDSSLLLNLSAFLCAAGYWQSTLQDILRDIDHAQTSAIKEVFKGVILANSLSHTGLSKDADVVLQKLKRGYQENQFILSEVTTKIDIEPNWSLTEECDLDTALIEESMYCSSDWILWNAGTLLIQLNDQNGLETILRRLLENGEYHTLRTAARMIPYLKDDSLIRSLIFDRLNKELTSGCQYLFEPLSNVTKELDDELLGVIRKGLFDSGPITAKESTKLLSTVVQSGHQNVLEMLQTAFEYWLENEEPYPNDGSTIPPSPRKRVLSILLEFQEVSFDVLVTYLADSRSDIQEVALNHLLSKIENQKLIFNEFIEAIKSETVAPSHLNKVISKHKFDSSQIESVCELLRHSNLKIRSTAFRVLRNQAISKTVLRKWLSVLIDDSDEGIREEAVLMFSKF